MGGNSRWALVHEISAIRPPAMLLAFWIGYRLCPYVPAVEVNKYWIAVEPIFLHPNLTTYDLLRDTAMWLTVGVHVEAAFRRRGFWLLFPLLAGSVMVGDVLVARRPLSVSEIAGTGLVAAWLSLAGGTRLRITVVLSSSASRGR